MFVFCPSECLPVPIKTEHFYEQRILIFFVVLQILLFFEAYGLRSRRVIAAFFYRKREKKRILFLYNEMLKKRKGFLKHMRTVIKRKARQQKLEVRTTYEYMCSRLFIVNGVTSA